MPNDPARALHAPPPLDPAHAWRHVLSLAATLEAYVAQLRTVLGLSSNEMNAVLLLWDGGACTMTELSRRIQLSRPALTTLVDRLEEGGLVVRSPDPRDRRQVIVEATPLAEERLLRHSRAWRQRLQNHASASDDWSSVLVHVDELRHVSSLSARELSGGAPAVRRPAP